MGDFLFEIKCDSPGNNWKKLKENSQKVDLMGRCKYINGLFWSQVHSNIFQFMVLIKIKCSPSMYRQQSVYRERVVKNVDCPTFYSKKQNFSINYSIFISGLDYSVTILAQFRRIYCFKNYRWLNSDNVLIEEGRLILSST